ncbi:Mce family protein [Gordonia effusa NBRC 100432]|uniref:Mce family protein n=1 Tax=Gordonia effusa NBRC 100432 TaxID=1077974 RepID=H0R406_9ACTN|nr:MlaD family protein [Gordonia effusa]GAB19807.1 Mce family protein [Gordonia effusa NBRC 100432]
MRSVGSSATRLAIFAIVMIALTVVVANTITRPAPGDQVTYQAMFTDANGLRPNDDVRVRGLQIGKVVAVDLDDASFHARVTMHIKRDQQLRSDTVLAIRFQSLAGIRYVDVQMPEAPGQASNVITAGHTFPVEQTRPSFDITTVFNGLQPVLRSLKTDDVNRLGSTLAAVIGGDSTELGNALSAVDDMLSYTSDRQAVIERLLSNLKSMSEHLGGRSGSLTTLLGGLEGLIGTMAEKIKGIIEFGQYGISVLRPLNSILNTLGITEETNPDLATILHRAIPDPQMVIRVLDSAPALLQSLANALPGENTARKALTCSKGAYPLPTQMAVFIGGKQVTLCKR